MLALDKNREDESIMYLEEKNNEEISQLTKELIEPIATGHVLAILKEQEGLSVTKFIDKYLNDEDGGVDEQSFRRWTKEGVQPRKEIIEKVKKIPNYQKVYDKAEQIIKERYFEFEVGDQKLDVINMTLYYTEIEKRTDKIYVQNKDFLQQNKDVFSIQLRMAEYSKFLTKMGSGTVDFYPLMIFLLDAQNKKRNNEMIDSDFNEKLETLISNLKEDIVGKVIG